MTAWEEIRDEIAGMLADGKPLEDVITKLEQHKNEPMTNEEYLRSCSADELAGAIYEWYTLGFTRGKNGKKLNSITEIVGWLKEIHE